MVITVTCTCIIPSVIDIASRLGWLLLIVPDRADTKYDSDSKSMAKT